MAIGSGSDTMNFGYTTMTNDGVFVARLDSQQTGGKMGIMLRESTNANSKLAAVLLDTSPSRVRFPTRNGNGAGMVWIDGPTASVPQWFKLQRSGNTFTGSTSEDGVAWTPVGTNTITMNGVLLAGFAVCSRSSGNLSVSVFDNVKLPTWTPPPDAPLGLTATASNALVQLKWNCATNAQGYFVKRASVAGGPYLNLAAVGTTNYTDATVTNGRLYYYVVTATDRAGEGATSAGVSAFPVSLMPPQLTMNPSGGQLQFSWPADQHGWRLLVQTNSAGAGLGTNWVEVPGSSVVTQMSFPASPADPCIFTG